MLGAMKKLMTLLTSMFLLVSCAGTDIDVKPVTNFDADKYLGKWYEIARLDHPFERGLSDVTATYSKGERGKIIVENRGYNEKKSEFEDATGNARFAVNDKTGHLSVSFFGPFYGDYIIFDMDQQNYLYAYVSGGKDNYLWLLSRQPQVNDVRKQDFINKAAALGYDTDALIWVDHSRAD